MEKEFTERDMEILRKLADILKVSDRRTEVVSHVSEGLEVELQGLSNFLDTVASRRPKGESQS